MSEQRLIRIFFAIDLPPKTKEAIGKLINAFKKKSKSRAIRWTKLKNLHITLQFLAACRSEHIGRLLDQVRSEVSNITNYSPLKIGGVHLFPHVFNPRVIVLDIAPQEELANLAKAIGRGITTCDYEIDDRPFRGHLTLGRIKYKNGVKLDFLKEQMVLNFDEIVIHEVVLFRSDPLPDGSCYTPIERITLPKL